MFTDLHVVTTDLPKAVENAQLTDAYFLLKSLHEQKINIYLHCLTKNPETPSTHVSNFCKKILFYDRDLSKISLNPNLPFHVSTRKNQKLIDTLNNDDFPVIFLGLATAYPILNDSLRSKKKFAVRLNKNEPAYFQKLAGLVPWKGKKIHYHLEAWRMSNFIDKLIQKKTLFFASSDGMNVLPKNISEDQVCFFPLFTGMPPIFHQAEKGHFCLFYGSLSNEETSYTAFWLLQHVFNKLEIPFVIAGSFPSMALENAAHVRQHTCLVANPSDKELQDLIKKAQLVLSPSFIQLNNDDHLIQALALGKHVLINPKRTNDEKIAALCHTAQSPEEFKEKTSILFDQLLTEENKYARQQVLSAKFTDEENIKKIISWLSMHYQ